MKIRSRILTCYRREKRTEGLNFPYYIAKRYLFSKSSNNAINIITGIAAVGIIVGAMSLFIVLSGFSGLKDFSLQYTNVFDADLKIQPAAGKTLQFGDEEIKRIEEIGGISAYSKIVEERIFLNFRGKNHIAYIKGVDENYTRVNPTDSILLVNDWFVPYQNEVVVGLGTAYKLSLGVRDYSDLLEIYVPKPGIPQTTSLDPSSAFQKESVVVSGIYEVNEELNSKYVFADLEMARRLLQLDSTAISAIEIKLGPNADEEEVADALGNVFKGEVLIKNRIQQNDALYKMLNTENIAVYLIFTLVLIIALFNVVGSIIMMILDKRKNIRTLFNLGATIHEIRRVFFLQGALMTTLGGALGIIMGMLVVYLQLKFDLLYITDTLPYPVQFKPMNVLVVFSTITVLGILASKLAASRVSTRLLD